MLNHKRLLPEGILDLEPEEPLEAADFEGLADEIDLTLSNMENCPA